MEAVMPGYYWYFSRGERELNVGLGYMMYPDKVGSNIRDLNEQIRNRRYPQAEIIKSQGDQIPARLPLASCLNNGFMTAGDAAALANPINGEGHGPAIMSGIKAGKIATKAIEDGDVSEKNLWAYNKFIWSDWGVGFSWGVALVKFWKTQGFDSFNFLLKKGIFQSDDLMLMNQNPEAKISMIRRAVRGWYRPRLLWKLRQTIVLARKFQSHARNYPELENFDVWVEELKILESIEI